MEEIKELLKRIEDLKEVLYKLINNNENLQDCEIIAVSRLLDMQLNEYYKLLSTK
ncbi:MAG: Spo0E family sporulation regulatory protein-aspartic acid phosphatase [Caulobacteraceae bacterium]